MELVISAANAGRRLDRFLFAYLNNAPHSFIYKMLRKKRIKLNGGRALGSEMLAEGDVLRFFLSCETIAGFKKSVFVPEAGPMPEIVYEDENLIVVNKPAGLPSQGGVEGKDDHLLARLLYYLKQNGGYPPNADFTPGICNRLDVNTSGLVVCGKNLKSLQEMNALFKNRFVEKEYLAVVDGAVGKAGDRRKLSHFHCKDENARNARIVDSGALIETEFTVIAVCKTHSLLRVFPISGKFHQIRVHLAHIGFPISGDKKYGGTPNRFARHQLLHCRKIFIPKLSISWEALFPMYFFDCINELFGKGIDV